MIQHVAVIGLGTMGSVIAQVFAAAGCRVTGFDQSPQAGAALSARLQKNLDQMAAAGLADPGETPAILKRIEVSPTEAAAAANADFVIEAVAEEPDIKRALFTRLEDAAPPRAILATNTSSLSVADITGHLRRQERVVVAHWFNPPHVVPVVEVVPGPKTSPDTMQQTIDLLRRAGKVPIRLNRDIQGFIVNRVQVAMMREVWDLLQQNIATAADIDAAIRGSMGFRLAVSGPLEVCDFGGLDIWRHVFENLAPDIRSDAVLPEFMKNAVERGHLGAKTGRGIHDHPPAQLEERRAQRDAGFLQLLKLFYPAPPVDA